MLKRAPLAGRNVGGAGTTGATAGSTAQPPAKAAKTLIATTNAKRSTLLAPAAAPAPASSAAGAKPTATPPRSAVPTTPTRITSSLPRPNFTGSASASKAARPGGAAKPATAATAATTTLATPTRIVKIPSVKPATINAIKVHIQPPQVEAKPPPHQQPDGDEQETEVFFGAVKTPERTIAATLKRRRRTLLQHIEPAKIPSARKDALANAAAIRIQAAFRRWRAQKQFVKSRNAANQLVKHWRRRTLRIQFRSVVAQVLVKVKEEKQRKSHVERLMARHRAAVKLQRWWRRCLACKRRREKTAAVDRLVARAVSPVRRNPIAVGMGGGGGGGFRPTLSGGSSPFRSIKHMMGSNNNTTDAPAVVAAAIAASAAASPRFVPVPRPAFHPAAAAAAASSAATPIITLPALILPPAQPSFASAAATPTPTACGAIHDALEAKRAQLMKIRLNRKRLEEQLLNQATAAATIDFDNGPASSSATTAAPGQTSTSSNLSTLLAPPSDDDFRSRFAALVPRGRGGPTGFRDEDQAERELQRVTRLNTLHNGHSLVTFELPDPEDIERQEEFLRQVDAMLGLEESPAAPRPTTRLRWAPALTRDTPNSPQAQPRAAPTVFKPRVEGTPYPYADCLLPQRVKVLPKTRGSRRGSALLDSPMGLQELLASTKDDDEA